MLTLFYKDTRDAACDCAIIKYVDRIWVQPQEKGADILRFFVVQNNEESQPLHRIHMLIPCVVSGVPEDLSSTCDDPNNHWNTVELGGHTVLRHLTKKTGFASSGLIDEDGIANVRFFAQCDLEVRNDAGFSIIDITFPEPIQPGQRVEVRSKFHATNVVSDKFPRKALPSLYRFDFSYLEPDTFDKFRRAMTTVFDASLLLSREIPIWTVFDESPTHPGGFDIHVYLPPNYLITDQSKGASKRVSDRGIDGKMLSSSAEAIGWRARSIKGGRKLIHLGDGWKVFGEFGSVVNIPEQLEQIRGEFQEKISILANAQQESDTKISSLTDGQKRLTDHLQVVTGNLTALIGDLGQVHVEMSRLAGVERVALLIATIGVLLATLAILVPALPSILAAIVDFLHR